MSNAVQESSLGEYSYVRRLWWLVVGVLTLSVIINYAQVVRITNNHDFAVYYQAAVNLRRGDDIYADSALFRESVESGRFDYMADDTVWPYAYPPLLAILLLPLSHLPYTWASGLWTAATLAALGAAMWLMVRALGPVTPPRLALALLLLYRYRPAVVALRLGQIDILILLLLAGVFYSLVRDRWWLAGVLLGLAVGLKFFAGVLIAYLFWKRRWRSAMIAGATAAVLLAGSFGVIGFDAVPAYLDFTALYSRGGFAGYPYHQCFNAFFTRLFTDNLFVAPIRGWDLPWLADGLTLISSGLVGLMTAWLTWGAMERADRRFALEFGLVITALLLVMPPSPLYSFAWLLLPFLALLLGSSEALMRARVGQRPGRSELTELPGSESGDLGSQLRGFAVLGLTTLAYILTARDYPYRIRYLIRLLQSHYLFGGLLLWCVLAWRLWSTRKDERLPRAAVSGRSDVK